MTTSANNFMPQSRIPIRRVIVIVFVLAAVAGGAGHVLTQSADANVSEAAPVAVDMSNSVSTAEVELPAPTHVPGHDGYTSASTAENECTGMVEPLYRHGEIRGWTCFGGGQ